MRRSPLAACLAALLIQFILTTEVCAQEGFEANYDEAEVPTYELPDPLRFPDGTRLKSDKAWQEDRRPHILRLFQEHVYGQAPGRPDSMWFETLETSSRALGG